MGIFNKFNRLHKDLPDTKEVLKIPLKIKETSVNIHANKITIRYFTNEFSESIDVIGEITRDTNIPLIFFNTPNTKGAILLISKFIYINRSKNNELTIDVSENYPYGIDKNSDLIKFGDIEYYNFIKDDIREKKIGKSKGLYYKERKFYIPVMLNEIPLPIIRLDDADRLQPVNKKYVKKLANISQSFLRDISDIKLLQRVGKKDSTGYVYVAILFCVIGIIMGLILSGFIR